MGGNSRLVYSTGGNNECPACGKPLRKCQCATSNTAAARQDNVVRISRETGGRGGKQVTVIRGLGAERDKLKKLLKNMKSHCGTGGTLKDDTLELQGDHRDALKSLLEKLDYVVKFSGG